MKKIKIICVVGATASGKTALAVELAKALDGEIISADSMQVYKDMPIATAVAANEEKQDIPHYLTEVLDVSESFSVADFVSRARALIDDIVSRGKIPIIAGGTGLFVDSLVKNITFADVKADDELRDKLKQKDTDELYNELLRVDKKSAIAIHKNNRKRVIRALELYYSGISKTEQNNNSLAEESPYEALYIGIGYENREKLYERINRRVDIMMKNGLEDEARANLSRTGKTARQAIGHKELKPYFDGEITLDEAVDNLKQETRHYAKRQLTWFRRNENISWLYADKMSNNELVKEAVKLSETFIDRR